MAYCSNCGHPLIDNAKFCSECGASVNDTIRNNRKAVFEGDVHKCPNCGEILNSFTVECPACGYELRNIKSSTAIREFSLKLEQIEASRGKGKRKLFGNGNAERENINKQRVNLIRNFSIPNTKEDVLEFMILAASNINLKSEPSESEREECDAWKAKFEQAYQKAEYQFGEDAEFCRFKRIYEQKMNEIKKEHRKNVLFLISLSVGVPVLIVIMCLVIYILN